MATLVLGSINTQNAANFAPHWGQDLAFFHQLVHSAANGGAWASPLILEPQGFLEMVHTHLILPVVVGAYTLVPGQSTLLWLHSGFAALTLWPAIRLGEAVGNKRYGLMAALAVLAFGPFQAVATADFRPLVLFVPGILGVFAAARTNRMWAALAWAAVALLGRQEAAYLIAASGLTLLLVPWGGNRKRLGLALLGIGLASLGIWTVLKPQMFFHFNPGAGMSLPDNPELWTARGEFGLRLLGSGWAVAAFSPAALLAGLPVIGGMLTSGHEWHRLVGPGAHHHAFWLPFVLASGIAGAARIPSGKGPLLLIVFGAICFPWAGPRQGPVQLRTLTEMIPADARAAADYDTIHMVAGREVLWNVDQLTMKDRPVHWKKAWPIPLTQIDWLIMPADHSLHARARDWRVMGAQNQHVLLQRAAAGDGQTGRPSPTSSP